MNATRSRCWQIANSICESIALVGLDDLPDLPCLMNALDAMEELIELEGDSCSLEDLRNIAQDAVFEILEEEGFPI